MPPGKFPRRTLRVAVAKSSDELGATTTLLARLLVLALLCVLAFSVSACVIAIRRGFSPVHDLARTLSTVTPGKLGSPIQVSAVPTELTPLTDKLNDLLTRLHAAFMRERHFTSDASHELRTPLAAIRSIVEVSLGRDRQPSEYRASLRETLSVAMQMSELVEDLFMLACADARALPVTEETIVVRGLVDDATSILQPLADERRLAIDNLVTDDATVVSDRDKLRVVVSNLLGNAVQYATEGSVVRVRAEPRRGMILEVSNSAPALADTDLERIFERFVRLDPSRGGTTEHAGVGLALVRSLCEVLGFRITARNDGQQRLVFVVEVAAHEH